MAIPLQVRALWTTLSLLDRAPVFQQPRDKVRRASNRRNRSARLPGAWLITGRRPAGVAATERAVEVAPGVVLPLRIHRPKNNTGRVLPVVVNFHGGGFVAGGPYQSDWWAASVCAGAEVVVVSPAYRLAPEHPYPTGPEDAYAATRWVADNAVELGVDSGRLAVMGDSAGGNLAAVVALMARDRGGPPIAFQLLLYPVVDFVENYPSEYENAHAPVLNKKDMDNVPRLYFAPGEQDRQREPYASPLRADSHADLPPALIQTAEHDPLRDQGEVYAAVLRAAGVPVRVANYVDAVHGYISLSGVVPVARQALADAVAALREVFIPAN